MHINVSQHRKDHPPYTICEKSQPSLTLAYPGSDEYEALSRHITTVYDKTYGANIYVTYPLLLGFVDARKNPLAALGIRCAVEESPLFLEHYLDQPAESCLHAITGEHISRHTIAEAGNLASSGNGDILMLLYGLACHLDQEGMSVILFTGTSLLKRYLHSLGLYPHVLAEPDSTRLGANAARWGSYYDTRPKVMAGSVQGFRKGLESYFHKSAQVTQ
jgi:hypothetical protein